MAYVCGCYYQIVSHDYYVHSIRHYLPLLDTEAHSTILATSSRTLLKQTFTNPSSSDSIKECIYTFPLYDGVAVVDFTCRIGSRVLRGVCKEKAKAKAIYDKAVARGETAGLLSQAPEAADVFSTKLGNIKPGESVVVEITYVGELKNEAESDGIRFTIPTKIAPRYGSGPNERLVVSQIAPRTAGGMKITVDISLADGSFIKGVQSPSHPIAVSMGVSSTNTNAEPSMNKASASLSLGSTVLEKDFVLVVLSKDQGIPKALLETHSTIANQRALMATLVPKFSLPPSKPEIVFVVDRSGSMNGNIDTVVSAMKVFLKSIPIGIKFNICSYGSDHTFLWPQSKSYGKDSLAQAIAHVETFSANYGGTETFQAIKATIEQRFKDLDLEIMLLTDGDIWDQEGLFTYLNEQVQQSKGAIRVFPLGIGNGVSHSLIEGVARAGNGFAQAVQIGEQIDNRVVRMLRGALSPHITDYTLEVKYGADDADDADDFEMVEKVADGEKVMLLEPESPAPKADETPKPTMSLFDSTADPDKMATPDGKSKEKALDIPIPKLLQAPNRIPALFPFIRTVVYLILSPESVQRNPTAVVLRATAPSGPLELEIPIDVLSERGDTIHQLAARKAVQDLEEGRGWLYHVRDQSGVLVKERFPSKFDDLVEKEAVRLGEQFQVASKWCSFVAVDPDSKATQEDDGEAEPQMDFSRASKESENTLYGSASIPPLSRSSYAIQAVSSSMSSAKPMKKKSAGLTSFFGGLSMSPASSAQSTAPGGSSLFGGSELRMARSGAPAMRSSPPPPPAAPAPMLKGSMVGAGSDRGLFQSADNSQRHRRTEPAPVSPHDKVRLLIELQDFEGWWQWSTELGTTMALSKAIYTPKQGVDSKVWVTMLVVRWLEGKLKAIEDVWELVVEKARAWLASAGAGDLQLLANDADAALV